MKELLRKLRNAIYNVDYATNHDSPAKNEIANAIAFLNDLEELFLRKKVIK